MWEKHEWIRYIRPLSDKKVFSIHLVSLRFYQPLDPKPCLPSDSFLLEDRDNIKASMRLYNQASRPTWIRDLSKLTLNLDICLKNNEISLRFFRSTMEDLEKKLMLFANCKRDTLVLFLSTEAFDEPLSYLSIILLKTLAAIVKRNRKRRSSCFKPLVASPYPLAFPITSIGKHVEDK